ncbi:hypothetical protein GCM10023100_73360 [Actinocorallia cavernae]|uniref:Uncharacterized protein n=2 Tax=Actinomycetes TaxID=1760 RepID=A0ABP8T6X5_9ACTN
MAGFFAVRGRRRAEGGQGSMGCFPHGPRELLHGRERHRGGSVPLLMTLSPRSYASQQCRSDPRRGRTAPPAYRRTCPRHAGDHKAPKRRPRIPLRPRAATVSFGTRRFEGMG